MKEGKGKCDRARHGECMGMEGSNHGVESERDYVLAAELLAAELMSYAKAEMGSYENREKAALAS